MAPETTYTDIFRYICECNTILGVLSFVLIQQGDELKNQGIKAFMKSLVNDLPKEFFKFVFKIFLNEFQKNTPPKAVFLVSNLLILACIPCRFMGDVDTEEALLIFAVPGSWFLLMFFAG